AAAGHLRPFGRLHHPRMGDGQIAQRIVMGLSGLKGKKPSDESEGRKTCFQRPAHPKPLHSIKTLHRTLSIFSPASMIKAMTALLGQRLQTVQTRERV